MSFQILTDVIISKMPTSFFSIVIPTLNEEDYLPILLDSLMEQIFPVSEVIIVDAGSEDETLAIAERYKDRFQDLGITFKPLTSDKKKVAVQRNLGAEEAEGKFVAFFDADVQVPPLFLHEIRAHIHRTDTKFVTTLLKADSNGIDDDLTTLILNLGILSSIVIKKPFAIGSNIIIARDVFGAVGGFDEQAAPGREDFDFSLRVHKEGYPLTIARNTRQIYSLRRFRASGRRKTIINYLRSSIHALLRKDIGDELYDYPMGGKSIKELEEERDEKLELKIKKLIGKLLKEQSIL